MQTILGSNGPIGHELAVELARHYTQDIRLVSRHPTRINPNDELVAADMLNAEETNAAIAGSDIVYFTLGLPMNSTMWEEQFPTMLANVMQACQVHHSKLVFFDNTYMYPKTAAVQTEDTPFAPEGRKATVRAKMATMLLTAMAQKTITAVICRAPEFYGPAGTKSITNTLLFKNLQAGKRVKVPVSQHTSRSLIWTPDASRAMALIGNTPDCYGQTWHLPIDRSRTYQELLRLAEQTLGHPIQRTVIPMWQFKLGALVSTQMRELAELLPRYQVDNRFSAAKFNHRFPDFTVTTFEQGIRTIFG
ncbi:NAD-dependent epimerase/dehydratase family protein [Levilactobacillus namurensis]|uniref:NAD-dependent epimerase/dehydratase family protein n=1 Tax=Levilactobacillus namurensis TaxID=380393 RepID=A0AAW8W033_9LACO|nr:NAD-dependent epimerase/dehydratase family protein [Levilactobacillus namurensis]MDT7013321.1 NAD-dependent epimerase/dehydratase family protein [Levilactobacillus namurensis]